jgi:hypothetical protein
MMRRTVLNRIAKCVLIVMLILATGGHWALLQSVAWLGMTVEFSEREPLTAALQKTFDGLHPCGLCKFVEKGRQAEKQQQIQKHDVKLELFCERAESYPDTALPYLAPPFSPFHVTDHLISPPTPPPRPA